VRAAGEPTNVALRRGTPPLFVGVDEDDRHNRRLGSDCPQGREGEHHLCQSALHVEHPGAAHLVAVHLERHVLQGAAGPDGVAVADEELNGPMPGPLGGMGVEVLAAPVAPRQPLDLQAERSEEAAQPGLHLGLRLGLVGRRLRPHQGL